MRIALGWLVFVAATLSAQEPRTKSRSLFGFEEASDIAKLAKGSEQVDLIRVQDNGVTEGKNCARLVVPKGTEYGVLKLTGATIANWSDFDFFAMDVMAEDDHPYTVVLELWDAASKNYATRCTFEGTKTRAGRQTLLYPIHRAKRNNKEGREWEELEPQDKINLNGLTQVKIFLLPRKDRDCVLWIDNLRLLQEDAAKPKFRVPLPQNAFAFNFGSVGTNAPGFKSVAPTIIFGKNDFGFANSQGLTFGGDGWPDLLAGTFVMAPEGKSLEFRAKLPNGDYHLWLIAGPILRKNPDSRRFLLQVNESSIIDANPSADEYLGEKWFYRFLRTPHSQKPHALWNNFIDRMYPTHLLTLTIKDGTLKIDAINFFLSAAVLVPAASKGEFDSFTQSVRNLRVEAFEANVRPLPVHTIRPNVDDTNFRTFVPEPSRTLLPWTAPGPGDDSAKLIAAAAPGQRCVMRVAFTPFIDVGACTLELADLRGPGVIPSSAIRAYHQAYRYDGEQLQPMALIPSLTVVGERLITQCYWLWLEVPEKTASGVYKSEFKLTSSKGVQKIPVELEVYPFRLEETMPLSLGMYYQRLQTDAKLTREQFDFMRQIGFTAVGIGSPTVTGLNKGDVVRMQFDSSLLDLAKQAGLGKHPKQYLMGGALGIGRAIGRRLPGSMGATVDRQPGIELKQPEFRSYFMNGLKQYKEWIDQTGMPIAVEIVDEPREVPNPWNRNLADTIAYAKMIRAAGLKGFVTPMADSNGGKDYTVLAEHADIVSVHAWKASEGLMSKTKQNKGTLWLYNTGMDRFSWGFYNWRVGSEGRWEWHFCWPEDTAKGGYPGREWYNPFTGSHGMAPLAPATYPGGMLFQPAFLDVAEGINDYRYIYTLERTIERCLKAGTHLTTVKEATAFLEALRRGIPAIPGAKGLVSEADGALVGLGIQDEARLKAPEWRAKIAGLLKKMQ